MNSDPQKNESGDGRDNKILDTQVRDTVEFFFFLKPYEYCFNMKLSFFKKFEYCV